MRAKISIHALRVEGDRGYRPLPDTVYSISIHALRVEGDEKSERLLQNRHQLFLSTPSGWRATLNGFAYRDDAQIVFLSTPSGWRATTFAPRENTQVQAISIHALRVEGDIGYIRRGKHRQAHFYPRPPGGGRPLFKEDEMDKKHFYPRPPGGGRRRSS